jgi:hypothetical protein
MRSNLVWRVLLIGDTKSQFFLHENNALCHIFTVSETRIMF